MRPFTSRRTRLLLAGAAVGAALAAPIAKAHADPYDTVGVQAAIVCASLNNSPTVATIIRERDRLMAYYTESSENDVMHYAMNVMCPQYQYLAWAAMRQILAQGQGVSI